MVRKFGKVNHYFNSFRPLLSKVLLQARENSTLKTYTSYFDDKWKIWAASIPEVNILPAEEFHIVLYMIYLLQTGKTYPVIRMSYFAINYFHTILGYQNPCTSHLIYNVLEGIKRLLTYSATKKSPVTVQQLYDLYKKFGGETMNLANLRTMLICLLSFMGCLRFSEVINLRRCDIIVNNQFLSIFIEKSKTDVYREGSWIYITRLDSALCPIRLVSRYFEQGNIKGDCQKYIFRGIITCTSHQTLRKKDKHVSYTCVRENVLEGLKNTGVNIEIYGLHSLRAGGATAAANMGVNDRLFKKHGRWKSEKVKDGYIHESIETKLIVTKNLGF